MRSSFTVVGKVVGKPRPKFRVVAGHPQAYQPRGGKAYERLIADEYRRQCGRMHEGALAVVIYTFRALPKGTPKRVVSEPDTVKPDADNIAKSVLDALNGVAWRDDTQVVHLQVRKNPRTRCEERIEVEIVEVTE